jgi:hypothetical protein
MVALALAFLIAYASLWLFCLAVSAVCARTLHAFGAAAKTVSGVLAMGLFVASPILLSKDKARVSLLAVLGVLWLVLALSVVLTGLAMRRAKD